MKLIQVYQTDPSSNDQGGGVRYVRNLTCQLIKNNIKLTFIGVGKTSYENEDITFISVDSRVRGYISFGVKLLKYAINKKLLNGKIVHVHRLYYGLPFSLFKSMTGCKVICTLHGRTFEVFKDRNHVLFCKLAMPLFYFVEYISLLFVDSVIPVSNDVVESFVKKYPSLKSKISKPNNSIPSMLNLSDFAILPSKSESLSELGLSSEYSYLCFVGRFAKVKDINFLIGIVRENTHYFIDNRIKIILCGHGEDFDEINQSINTLGLFDCFVITGVIKPQKIKHIYNVSEATLICSHHEAAPTVLIESIAANTPVISNDVGDVKDVVLKGNVGILAKKTTECFFNSINNILENGYKFDDELAREIVKSRNSETISKRYIDKYMELI